MTFTPFKMHVTLDVFILWPLLALALVFPTVFSVEVHEHSQKLLSALVFGLGIMALFDIPMRHIHVARWIKAGKEPMTDNHYNYALVTSVIEALVMWHFGWQWSAVIWIGIAYSSAMLHACHVAKFEVLRKTNGNPSK
ncbi:hypothetical protein pVco7_gp068 [Vibrio phage pVco-7]|uniref:Uncharacterized protein n=1 Tax=Vibrio phage pVco-5 TaxID=1965485 RepID=A0A1W6JUY0_9CAUD|nr:hypothetical protein KNT61_gp069 [Vibrio phage pVco-5]ARM71057.1 hypothetical protein pVco5_069 [Vibrio phage pVco-5]